MSAPMMCGVRCRLRFVAAIWLLCQLAAIGGAPVLLSTASATTAAASDEDCCPGVAPGQVCPMHHTKAGARHCQMRSACGSPDAALLTIAGVIFAPSAAAWSLSDTVRASRVSPAVETPVLRAIAPESPPPRA